MKNVGNALLMAMVLLALPSAARADDKEELLATVGRKVTSAHSNRDPQSPYDERNLKGLRTSTAECLAAVDAAVAGGATMDELIYVDTKAIANTRPGKNKLGYTVLYAPMRDVQAYCRELAAKPTLLELDQGIRPADDWLARGPELKASASGKEDFDNDSRNTAEAMLNFVKPCTDAVAKAKALGVPGTAKLKLKNSGELTVDDAKAKVCDALGAAAEEVMAIEAAKLEKKLAPFKAVLKGDKLSTFLEREMVFDDIYGVKGVRLDTPEKLQAASAWFIVLTGDIGLGLKTVTVRRYKWSGNKSAGVTEKTGCCTL